MILYLACPYSHPDPAVREYRYSTVNRVAALLMKSNIVVFSPLSHSVTIARHIPETEMDHQFWLFQDLPLLRLVDEVLIVGLEGWTESRGVKAELFEAMALGKPVTQIEEGDIDLLPKIPKSARRFLESNILKEADEAERRSMSV